VPRLLTEVRLFLRLPLHKTDDEWADVRNRKNCSKRNTGPFPEALRLTLDDAGERLPVPPDDERPEAFSYPAAWLNVVT